MASIFRDAAVDIAKGLAPTLSEVGFKRSGLSFLRETEPGLFQFIDFQLSTGNVGALANGKFTLNLGIYVAEVDDHQRGENAKPSELCSLVRERIGTFVAATGPAGGWWNAVRARLGFASASIEPSPGDRWWHFDRPTAVIAAELSGVLRKDVLPWLDACRTRDGLLEFLRRPDEPIPAPYAIGAAVILKVRGQEAEARAILQRGIDEADRPQLADFIRREAKLMGIAGL